MRNSPDPLRRWPNERKNGHRPLYSLYQEYPLHHTWRITILLFTETHRAARSLLNLNIPLQLAELRLAVALVDKLHIPLHKNLFELSIL